MFRMRYKEDVLREAVEGFLALHGALCGSGKLRGVDIAVILDRESYPEDARVELRGEVRGSDYFLRMTSDGRVREVLDWHLQDALRRALLQDADDPRVSIKTREDVIFESAAARFTFGLWTMALPEIVDDIDDFGNLSVGATVEIGPDGALTLLRLAIGEAREGEIPGTVRLGGDYAHCWPLGKYSIEARVRRQHRQRRALGGGLSADRADGTEATWRRPAIGPDRGTVRPADEGHR